MTIPRLFKHILIKALRAKLYRWISEVVVGGEVILRPKNICGEFTLSATSHLTRRIITDQCYEPEMSKLLKDLSPKGDCINIGANVGLLAVHLASLSATKRIFALEPNPEAYRLLQKNIIANGHEGKIVPIQCCAGADTNDVKLAIVHGMPEYSSIDKIVHESTRNKSTTIISAACTTIDLLVEANSLQPDLLLIDTEGAEISVLKGATQTLACYKPVVCFELDHRLLGKFGVAVSHILSFFESLNYHVASVTGKHAIDNAFIGDAIARPRLGRPNKPLPVDH